MSNIRINALPSGTPSSTDVLAFDGTGGTKKVAVGSMPWYEKPATGVPKTDLNATVQVSLEKADSAYQKASTGIPATDLTSALQADITKLESAISISGIAYQSGSGTSLTWDGVSTGKETIPISDEYYYCKVSSTAPSSSSDLVGATCTVSDGTSFTIASSNIHNTSTSGVYYIGYDEGMPIYVLENDSALGSETYTKGIYFAYVSGDYTSSLTYGSSTTNKIAVANVNGAEATSNKVTSMTSSSTDTQYPSAKAVYDELSSLKEELAALGLSVVSGKLCVTYAES